MFNYSTTHRSSNRKIGQISCTMTERASCPSACPLRDAGCYADGGPVAIHWRKLDQAGKSLDELCQFISEIATRLWRHNVAGDLASIGRKICLSTLRRIIVANTGKMGFTYTHHDMALKHNRDAVAEANARGFTVNLSANNLHEADKLADLAIGPVVTLLPETAKNNVRTPSGRNVVVCPAVLSDDINCQSCRLCARSNRQSIIGFPVHGTRRRKADVVARAI